MGKSEPMELGLTIPLQRRLHIKALPYSCELDRRFCWDLHIIPLRQHPSLLAVHCYSRYTFVLYDLSFVDWAYLPDIFQAGLERSLSAAGLSVEAANLLCGNHQPLFTKTHGRREVAFLNRAWDDVMAGDQITPNQLRKRIFISRELGVPQQESGGARWFLNRLLIDQDAIPTGG